MNPKKSSFINKVIFFVLNKIFSKCYKSLLSRKLYKGLIKIDVGIVECELIHHLLDKKSSKIYNTNFL